LGKRNKKSRAVFLDRDGTIIHEKNYLRKIKEVKLLGGSARALRMLKDAGFKLIVVTNQSGVARGYLNIKKLKEIHRFLQKLLRKKGVKLDAIYFCPHGADSRCLCRKPKLGMVNKAKKRFNLDLRRSFAVGDHTKDFLLGQNMGGKGIFLLTGHGKRELKKIHSSPRGLKPDKMFKNLLGAAKYIAKK